jgi:uncharacterized SAM-binding protein YcdF (DUF218 family)
VKAKRKTIDLKGRLWEKRRKKLLRLAPLIIIGAIFLKLIINFVVFMPLNATKPVDAILVLGGSIRREIYAAQIAKNNPKIPILISTGSLDPCIRLIFAREHSSLENVWLEKCAESTFGNFFYGVPILKGWGVHKVKVITSPSHLPRAQWLAEINLGTQGIATEIDLVNEQGIPGNQETPMKTRLDVMRSLLWAVASQVISPNCNNIVPLTSVDLESWQAQGFECESQGKVSY